MPILSRSNVDSRQIRYATQRDQYKGKTLYEKGMVRVVEFTGESAICEVSEKNKTFQVTVKAITAHQAQFSCTCPTSKPELSLCPHSIAALYSLRDYLREVAEKDWRYRVELTFEITPPPKAKPERTEALVPAFFFIGLEIFRSSAQHFYKLELVPYFISAEHWPPLNELATSPDPRQAAIELLTSRDDWYPLVQVYTGEKEISLINLSYEAQQLVNILIATTQERRWYYPPSSFYSYVSVPLIAAKHLPLLGRMAVPIFLHEEKRFVRLLHVASQSAPLQAILIQENETYELIVGMALQGQHYILNGEKLKIFDSKPTWALAEETLVQVENPEALPLLSIFPIRITQAEVEDFRTRYSERLTKYLPITGESVKWEIVQVQPVPRLYLSQRGEEPLDAELRFGYDGYEFPFRMSRKSSEEIIEIPGQWGGIKVLRDQEREQYYYQLLVDARYGLKRAGDGRPEHFLLRARTHPFDFLTQCIPALTQAGFEIYGEENIAKVNRAKPALNLTISSGIDWFDVQAVVQYGDQQVNLNEIRRAFRRGERYIKLADGSIGQIPEEWLQRYKQLFALAEETADGLRVTDLQLSLLDELLAETESQTVAPEFYARRERLKSFEHIVEHPLPQGFHGELRPYQKSGYDWLHFLHEYGFGGILADDMGLGKTVQTLVFLLSLKERGELPRPALLVVPKSLLVNWQRETERFTPDLRILEYTGQGRKKQPAHFEGYDIVITTYGTMLRDIEILRAYRFTYAILDESQAIKNPLAQSSKAARLLQTDHRLCLTGTPVENNVYELWSQFAFLNPGLLGNFETFKSEFASAIERRDEAAQSTMQLLRRLIYPFVLRRTKQQVAPELPPRTERIIYTDLEPTQRKLYQQTRDYYRSLLLGLLEENQDINDIRFKILEGLLRLRQVCIHPRLIQPTYHGASAKFEVLLETLETLRAEGHKALVFSQFVQALSLLRQELDARGIPYAYLDGQTPDRQKQVDRFQNDPDVRFFLISLKAGGVGLNLTAADYALHIDPWWNPAVEMQAADRAHRIGQDKPVFIYKFIARETVEEKIMQLQERKRELVEQLISAESGIFKSLTKEDVQVLFS